MLDDPKFNEIMDKIMMILSEVRATPEDGMEIAQEILMMSIERFAKQNNTTPEEISKIIAKQQMHQTVPGAPNTIFGLHGWVGNDSGLKEDN